MCDMMTFEVKKRLIDRSTQVEFCFGIVCECCGVEYRTLPVPLASAGMNAKAREHEHRLAFEQAVDDMRNSLMNRCPRCHHYVCDDCFILCNEGSDRCRDCAQEAGWSGESVRQATRNLDYTLFRTRQNEGPDGNL